MLSSLGTDGFSEWERIFLILGLALADDLRTLRTSYLDIYGQNL